MKTLNWNTKKVRGQSLRMHVIMACVFLVLCTSFSTVYVFSEHAFKSINRDIGYNLTALSAQITQRLEEHVMARASAARTLSHTEDLMNPVVASRVVNDVRANDPGVAWSGIMSRDGTVVAGSEGILTGKNIAHRPVFSEGLYGMHYGDIHDAVLLASLLPADSLGRPTLFMDVSVPIKGPDGNTAGVMAIHLDWNKTRDLVTATLKNSDISVIILSKDGTVVLGPANLIGQNLSSMQSVAENGYHTETWKDGLTYISGTSKGGPFSWTVVLRENQGWIKTYINDAMQSTIPSIVLITILMVTIGWFTAEYITAPLRRLSQAADKIRKGEKAEIQVKDSYREIRILSNSLNSLLNSLTRQRLMVNQARDEAETDVLTGLPNRRVLMKAALELEVDGNPFAVVCMDLDGFKAVNDTYGHSVGDELLRIVSARIPLYVRSHDTVIRTGGDEFIILLPSAVSDDIVSGICNRIIGAISEPVILEGHEVHVGCSAGYALVPRDANDLITAIDKADAALYQAKKEGRMRTCVAKAD